MVAAVVEALWSVQAQLEAGIPVVMVKSTKKPRDVDRYPRPKWVKKSDKSTDDGVIVVSSPGEALRMMKAGADVN